MEPHRARRRLSRALGLAGSDIGAALAGPARRWRLAFALLVGVNAVAGMFFATSPAAGGLLAAGSFALVALAAGQPGPALGLHVRPRPSWRAWALAALVIGALIGAALAAYYLVLEYRGEDPFDQPPPLGSAGDVWLLLWIFCVWAPLVEEIAFRAALCAPLVALVGRWPAVALSGAAFAYLHIHRGVASPDNLLAGFFLGWAYVRSGTLLVPIALHALGNLCVVLWYLAWFLYAGR
jgi:membrane protease YdiL (CAAX protease family)